MINYCEKGVTRGFTYCDVSCVLICISTLADRAFFFISTNASINATFVLLLFYVYIMYNNTVYNKTILFCQFCKIWKLSRFDQFHIFQINIFTVPIFFGKSSLYHKLHRFSFYFISQIINIIKYYNLWLRSYRTSVYQLSDYLFLYKFSFDEKKNKNWKSWIVWNIQVEHFGKII